MFRQEKRDTQLRQEIPPVHQDRAGPLRPNALGDRVHHHVPRSPQSHPAGALVRRRDRRLHPEEGLPRIERHVPDRDGHAHCRSLGTKPRRHGEQPILLLLILLLNYILNIYLLNLN